jgi:hypothetical protein
VPNTPNPSNRSKTASAKRNRQATGKSRANRAHKRNRLSIAGIELPSLRRIQYEMGRLLRRLQRIRLPRLPRIKTPKLDFFSLLGKIRFPSIPLPFAIKGKGLSQRELLAKKCSILFWIFLAIFAILILTNLFPPQLTSPGWFLSLVDKLLNAGTIVIIALFFGSLASYFNLDNINSSALDSRVIWAGRLSSVLFSLLVLVQLTATTFFVQQLYSNNRAELRGLDRQLAPLLQAIKDADTTEQLDVIYRSLSGLQRLAPSITNQPFLERKQSLNNVIASNLKSYGIRLGAQTRQAIVNISINSIRNVLLSIALAMGCQAFAQWVEVRE